MSTEQPTGDGPSVPIFVTGLVTKFDFDICMDGASYILNSGLAWYRLKPSNEEAGAVLEKLAGTRMPVAVAGYAAGLGHCSYISVYSARPALELFEQLGISAGGDR